MNYFSSLYQYILISQNSKGRNFYRFLLLCVHNIVTTLTNIHSLSINNQNMLHCPLHIAADICIEINSDSASFGNTCIH